MAVAIHQISPVAHFPLVLGVVGQLNGAALIDTCCPPHPGPLLSCGRGVEALLLAILDGHHALYKVGTRLGERGMLPRLPPGLKRTALHDDRLGQSLDTLFAAHLHQVCGAVALRALEVYAVPTPWLHQATTTRTRYGADEAAPHEGRHDLQTPAEPIPPRPAYGPSQDGHDDLTQVLLSLGGSRDGLPLRLGLRDGHTRDSPETPVALEAYLALGLAGVRGLVADRKAYGQRTLGWCLERGVGLLTLVPRTWAVRQAWEAWGQPQGPWPLRLEKPGRTRQEAPRRWQGCRVVRRVAVASAEGRLALADLRFLVGPSRQWAQQTATTDSAAQATEAERVAEPIQRVEARWCAGAADAEAAITDDEGRGQGRRGRRPRLWRDHALHDRVAAVRSPHKRSRRGRPPKAEVPQVEVRDRLRVSAAAVVPAADAHGWTVLATTLRSEACTDVEMLQAYQEQQITVAPGFRWMKNPAAISPGWLEQPERMAALAMLTVVGWLVYAVIQRQVRLYLRDHDRHIPGNTGAPAIPTAAVVCALLTPVTRVHFAMDHAPIRHVHGLQEDHLIGCEAVGIDHAWYRGVAAGQNSLPSTTRPWTWVEKLRRRLPSAG